MTLSGPNLSHVTGSSDGKDGLPVTPGEACFLRLSQCHTLSQSFLYVRGNLRCSDGGYWALIGKVTVTPVTPVTRACFGWKWCHRHSGAHTGQPVEAVTAVTGQRGEWD